MWLNPQFPVDLFTFIEETLDRKLHFLCSRWDDYNLNVNKQGGKSGRKNGKNTWICFKNLWKKSGVVVKSCSRSSRSQKKKKMFFKIGVLKNFAVFTGKQQYWSIFLIKLQLLGNLFWRTFVNDCFWTKWSPLNFFPSSCLMDLITTLYFFDKFKWNCGIACLFLVLALWYEYSWKQSRGVIL